MRTEGIGKFESSPVFSVRPAQPDITNTNTNHKGARQRGIIFVPVIMSVHVDGALNGVHTNFVFCFEVKYFEA